MAVVHFIGLLMTWIGYVTLAAGTAFSGWFAWNFKGFASSPHRHGDVHWGVVAMVFYATPAVVLLASGGLLILVGHIL